MHVMLLWSTEWSAGESWVYEVLQWTDEVLRVPLWPHSVTAGMYVITINCNLNLIPRLIFLRKSEMLPCFSPNSFTSWPLVSHFRNLGWKPNPRNQDSRQLDVFCWLYMLLLSCVNMCWHTQMHYWALLIAPLLWCMTGVIIQQSTSFICFHSAGTEAAQPVRISTAQHSTAQVCIA